MVINDSLWNLKNGFQCVYSVLFDAIDLRLQSDQKTVAFTFILECDVFHYLFGHRFFDVERDDGN